MTLDEAKTHFTRLAQESGLDDASTKAVLQAMENEKFRGNLSTGYKRHDEYSRDMDALRAERERLRQWYEREELPKYQLYTQSAQELQAYRDRYGQLQQQQQQDSQGLNNGRGGMTDSGNGYGASGGLTKEELDRYVEDKLRLRDQAYVSLTKDSMKAQNDYFRRFGRPLSDQEVDDIEKYALDRGMHFSQAYKEYISPKVEEANQLRHKEEIEKAKAEAIRDYQSRMKLPVDSKPKEAHPFFDRKTPDKALSEVDQDRHSRDAFMTGWNNYAEELQNKTT